MGGDCLEYISGVFQTGFFVSLLRGRLEEGLGKGWEGLGKGWGSEKTQEGRGFFWSQGNRQ